MTEIDSITAAAYAEGVTPIDWAIRLSAGHIDLTVEIVTARADNPSAYPIWGNRPLTGEATAGRIIASLLDAGWTPPTAEQIHERVAQVYAERRRIVADLDAGQVPAAVVDAYGYRPPRGVLRRLADHIRRSLPRPGGEQ